MKVFFVVSRFPWPLIKGDKLRAFHQIKELSESCEVHLCALSDASVDQDSLEALKPYCASINVLQLNKMKIALNVLYHFLFTNKPAQVGYFFQRKQKVLMLQLIENIRPNHIYCQLIRTSEYIKGLKDIPKTLDYMDALSAGMERRANTGNPLVRFFTRSEAKRLKRYEHDIFPYFDHHSIISESDRDLIFQYQNEQISILPNGIDMNYFKANDDSKEYDFLFTGNMSYPPNVESVKYLVKSIMPIIWKKFPNATLLISGANPDREVQQLSSKKVMVQGWVEDIREAYNSAKIFIAPMLIGSGMQNKLLEAMSMELPCITSELANKALDAKDNVELLVGQNDMDYANKAIELLENPEKAKSLAKKGFTFVQSNFNWSKANQILLNILNEGHPKS